MRPNPLTGGFSFWHIRWVDEQWIVLELIFNLALLHASIFCQWLALTTIFFNCACVLLKWLTDCVIKKRPEIRLHHSINSYDSKVKLSFKHLTICKLLKQRVFTYSPLSKCRKPFSDLFGFKKMSFVDFFQGNLMPFLLDYKSALIKWGRISCGYQ